jgi:hypothetical protein
MVDENIRMTHPNFEFVCITPHPEEFAGSGRITAVVPVYKAPELAHQSWYKANLFLLTGERVLYLDLDVAVMKKLTPLVQFDSDFVSAPPSSVPIRGYDWNSSVMVWNPNGTQASYIRDQLPSLPWLSVNSQNMFPFNNGHGDQKWLSSLPIRIDLFPSKWVQKYLVDKKSSGKRPPESVIVSLLIQGGKNKQLIQDGHRWIEEYWQ